MGFRLDAPHGLLRRFYKSSGRTAKGRQTPAGLWQKASRSRGHREELIEFRNSFAMVEAIGDHTQGKGLNSRDGLFAGLPVYHDPGKLGHLGDPASVVFTLDFDLDFSPS